MTWALYFDKLSHYFKFTFGMACLASMALRKIHWSSLEFTSILTPKKKDFIKLKLVTISLRIVKRTKDKDKEWWSIKFLDHFCKS